MSSFSSAFRASLYSLHTVSFVNSNFIIYHLHIKFILTLYQNYDILSRGVFMGLPNNQKGRYWAFVLYPESAPVDWKQILTDTGLPIAISPFHNRDINADLEVKKPHYHIILCWDGPTTYRNVCCLVCDQLHQPHPIKLEAVRGYFRYLTHEDNPEKAQYDPRFISFLNNFCIEDYDQPSEHELDIICKEILDIIRNAYIIEYSDLMDYLQFCEGHESHFRFARRNTLFLDSYIKSMRHKPRKLSEVDL